MIGRLVDFVEALRSSGIPVSILESIDAAKSLSALDISQRDVVRSGLACTLIKDHSHRNVFDQLFDVYFSPGYETTRDVEEGKDSGATSSLSDLSEVDIQRMIISALVQNEPEAVRSTVSLAVARFAGIEPGRPVGGKYYAYRTMRGLNFDDLKASLFGIEQDQLTEGDTLGRKLLNREIDHRLSLLKSLIEDEIKRRLVSDRGVDAVARTMRATLPEDLDFMHASADELDEISRSLSPLVRKLATRLERNRRIGHRGTLDFRSTIRKSMAFGGVPMELVFHKQVPYKPEILVVADISGSVSSFARFTLSMLYALSSQFSKVRSFVFIDEIDEVSDIFEASDNISDAMKRVNTKARIIWMDGHSDYGRVLTSFWERWGNQLSPRSTLIFLGDARNNYHSAQAEVLGEIRSQVKAIHWLNPEPHSYWDSGDSILGEYSIYCDSVNECRNLRQLQSFVERLSYRN